MFILGIIFTIVGVLMVWRSIGTLKIFGEIPWAEKNLQGGSIAFYKLLGVLFCFIGLLAITGLLSGLLLWLLTPLFGALAK